MEYQKTTGVWFPYIQDFPLPEWKLMNDLYPFFPFSGIYSGNQYPNKKIVEFKNNYELIDNGIITTEIYEKLKNNDNIYNLTVTEYLRLGDISSKESYNITKAIQTGIIKEDTIYADYFAKICGFKNKKELLKYTKAVFELAQKEK